MSRILIIRTSLRANSNSDALANRLAEGAKDAGHEVESVSLKGKNVNYCIGCMSCQKTGKCVLKDDAAEIMAKLKEAETLVFVTPIYYYEMSGQMKTLLDRMNPLYGTDYGFRRVYMLSVAADDDESTPEKALSGLRGWVDCFERAELCGSLFCGGITDPGDAERSDKAPEQAYNFGRNLA